MNGFEFLPLFGRIPWIILCLDEKLHRNRNVTKQDVDIEGCLRACDQNFSYLKSKPIIASLF